MLIHELFNKDSDIFPEGDTLIILDRKYNFCMTNNGKDTKHIGHISRRVHLVKNGENWKMHKIDWCEGGMKLVDIATKNVDENYFNTRMKYIMVRIDNW